MFTLFLQALFAAREDSGRWRNCLCGLGLPFIRVTISAVTVHGVHTRLALLRQFRLEHNYLSSCSPVHTILHLLQHLKMYCKPCLNHYQCDLTDHSFQHLIRIKSDVIVVSVGKYKGLSSALLPLLWITGAKWSVTPLNKTLEPQVTRTPSRQHDRCLRHFACELVWVYWLDDNNHNLQVILCTF